MPEFDVAHSQDVEALFRLPLNEFTAARNTLADRAKNAGSAEFAAHVRALTRPPLSAWVVNQLYWRHRTAFDRLIAAGARLRRAQASQLRGKGGDMREPLDARRHAIADLTRLAAAVARESGHAAGPDLLRRVTTTLDALATYAGDASGPRAGQLTADVDPPGFEALAMLVPAGRIGPGRHAPTHVLPFKKAARSKKSATPKDPEEEKRRQEADRRAERAAAAAAVRAAERDLAAARKSAARAEAGLKAAAARVKQAERLKARLTAQMEAAATEADHAREQARKIAASAENAAQAVADAERLLEEARSRQAQRST
jgi:hypothetical protein